MKDLRFLLDIVATSTALAALVFMGIVFYVETFGIMRNGYMVYSVTYLEPNKAMSFAELIVVAFSSGATFGMYLRRMKN